MVLALCATQDWLQVVKCIIHFLLQLCHLCMSTFLTQRQYKQLFLKNMPVSYSSKDGLHANQGAHAQSHEGMLQGHCCLRQAGRGRTFWHSVRSCSVMGQCVRWCSHSAELSTTMGSIASSSFSRKGPCRKPPITPLPTIISQGNRDPAMPTKLCNALLQVTRAIFRSH